MLEIVRHLKNMLAGNIISLTTDSSLDEEAVKFEHPRELNHGDYASNIALQIDPGNGINPRAFAELMMKEAALDMSPLVERVEVAGPGFINFYLSTQFYNESLDEIIQAGEDFGKNEHLKGQTWVIEHTSPNPNKAMHLGHLRNNLTGMSVANIAEWNGVTVIRDTIDNNRGIAIAKLMWGYLKFARKDGDTTKTDLTYWFEHRDEWQTPESQDIRPDRFVDNLYVKGAGDFKENKEVETIVRQMVIDWEAKDEKTWVLWELVLNYSYQGQELTLQRLGNKWDHKWHEHEIYEAGKKWVEKGLEMGVFKKGEGGAVVTDFSEYGIPDTVLLKSDGTALYITQDLELTKLKRDKYKADKLFWVIGPEQQLALKQFFTACEQLGIGKVEDYTHLWYGFMGLKEDGAFKKMSSRTGDVAFIDDLIDAAKMRVLEHTKDEALAEIVALGALKYSILRVGRTLDTAFDVETSVNIEGDSGPYLQYTHARCKSLLAKAAEQGLSPHASTRPDNEGVADIERLLYRFPEIIEGALDEYAPHHVANYLIEVARAFNSWYGNTPVLGEDIDQETSQFRLAIVAATSVVMKNGLWVLGIEAPERM